jgi:hypothetical protein
LPRLERTARAAKLSAGPVNDKRCFIGLTIHEKSE